MSITFKRTREVVEDVELCAGVHGAGCLPATVEDLRRACEAVGLHVVNRGVFDAIVAKGEANRVELGHERSRSAAWRESYETIGAKADEHAARSDVLKAENATLRAQLAEAEAQLAALALTEGRATDEELYAVFNGGIGASCENGIRAVSARVRQERPGCLVERLVAAETSFYVTNKKIGTDVQWQVTVHPNGKVQHSRGNVPAADVPATLARLAGLDGAT